MLILCNLHSCTLHFYLFRAGGGDLRGRGGGGGGTNSYAMIMFCVRVGAVYYLWSNQ